MSLGSLVGFFLLALAMFEDQYSPKGFHFSYEQLTRTQTVIFVVAFLIINVGMLFTLLRPETKEFFAPETDQQTNQ